MSGYKRKHAAERETAKIGAYLQTLARADGLYEFFELAAFFKRS